MIYFNKHLIKLVAELPTYFTIIYFETDYLNTKHIKIGHIKTNDITDWNYSILSKIYNKDFGYDKFL